MFIFEYNHVTYSWNSYLWFVSMIIKTWKYFFLNPKYILLLRMHWPKTFTCNLNLLGRVLLICSIHLLATQKSNKCLCNFCSFSLFFSALSWLIPFLLNKNIRKLNFITNVKLFNWIWFQKIKEIQNIPSVYAYI